MKKVEEVVYDLSIRGLLKENPDKTKNGEDAGNGNVEQPAVKPEPEEPSGKEEQSEKRGNAKE